MGGGFIIRGRESIVGAGIVVSIIVDFFLMEDFGEGGGRHEVILIRGLYSTGHELVDASMMTVVGEDIEYMVRDDGGDFLLLEIESQRRGPEVVSRCRKDSRTEISKEGGKEGEENFL